MRIPHGSATQAQQIWMGSQQNDQTNQIGKYLGCPDGCQYLARCSPVSTSILNVAKKKWVANHVSNYILEATCNTRSFYLPSVVGGARQLPVSGQVFASIGKSLGVLDSNLFAVVIIVVLLTTLVTPPMLKWAVERD